MLVRNGKYTVDLDVTWQATTKANQFEQSQGHQIWKLDDGNQNEWPRILGYIMERTKANNDPLCGSFHCSFNFD